MKEEMEDVIISKAYNQYFLVLRMIYSADDGCSIVRSPLLNNNLNHHHSESLTRVGSMTNTIELFAEVLPRFLR